MIKIRCVQVQLNESGWDLERSIAGQGGEARHTREETHFCGELGLFWTLLSLWPCFMLSWFFGVLSLFVHVYMVLLVVVLRYRLSRRAERIEVGDETFLWRLGLFSFSVFLTLQGRAKAPQGRNARPDFIIITNRASRPEYDLMTLALSCTPVTLSQNSKPLIRQSRSPEMWPTVTNHLAHFPGF